MQGSQEGEGEAAVTLVPKGTKSAGFVGFAVICSFPPQLSSHQYKRMMSVRVNRWVSTAAILGLHSIPQRGHATAYDGSGVCGQ